MTVRAKDLMAEIDRIVRSPAPRAEQAREAAEAIRRAGGFHWVGLYDVMPDLISAIAWTGATAPAHPTFPRTRGLNGAAVAAAAPVVSNDVSTDPRYLTTFAGTGAEMIVPILDATGDVVGTVDVESPMPGAFGAGEQALVTEAARALRRLWTGR